VSCMRVTSKLNRRRIARSVVIAACVALAVAACRPDAPATQAQAAAAPSTPTPADTQRVVLAVTGMYCTSCERTVAALLRRTPGVMSAEVSAARGEATIAYDAARTTPAQLAATIGRLGYTVTPEPT
jgi:copper chaperone CopZ